MPSAATPRPARTDAGPLPDEFSGTAWRAVAADGARYTTYLDTGGRYRDLRNGDPWQEGSWSIAEAGKRQICFLPDGEAGRQTCWQPDEMEGRRLYLGNGAGRRIELRQVEYVPPGDADTEDAAR